MNEKRNYRGAFLFISRALGVIGLIVILAERIYSHREFERKLREIHQSEVHLNAATGEKQTMTETVLEPSIPVGALSLETSVFTNNEPVSIRYRYPGFDEKALIGPWIAIFRTNDTLPLYIAYSFVKSANGVDYFNDLPPGQFYAQMLGSGYAPISKLVRFEIR